MFIFFHTCSAMNEEYKNVRFLCNYIYIYVDILDTISSQLLDIKVSLVLECTIALGISGK